MRKREIFGLFKITDNLFVPYGVNFWQKLWWRFVPGVVINVRWPRGNIVVDYNDPRWQDMGGAVWVDLGFSADPNDHYRWYMEKHIGRQGWDWNWGLTNNDATGDRLTIKIRQKYANYAMILAIKWS